MSAFTASVFVESFSAVSTLVSAYNSIVSAAKTGAIIALPVEVSVWTVTKRMLWRSIYRLLDIQSQREDWTSLVFQYQPIIGGHVDNF